MSRDIRERVSEREKWRGGGDCGHTHLVIKWL